MNTFWSSTLNDKTVPYLVDCDGVAHVIVQKYYIVLSEVDSVSCL